MNIVTAPVGACCHRCGAPIPQGEGVLSETSTRTLEQFCDGVEIIPVRLICVQCARRMLVALSGDGDSEVRT